MEREKQIKMFSVFVAVALVVSLIMNFTLFSKLGHLENQLNSISDLQHNVINNVNGQTNHIQSVLNDMQEEQRWITPIKMDVNPNDLEDGQTEVTFEWQVKELQKDSKVVFHYTYGDNEEFKALPVEEIQQGLFKVKAPIKVDMEPMWHVGVMNHSSKQEQSKKEMEEQMLQETLKYYVTVSYGELVKSGKVHTEHLGEYGSHLYGSIQTDVLMEDKTFSVMLYNHQADPSAIWIEEAYLLKYKDETLLGKEKFETDEQYDPADPMMNAFHVNQVKQYENMRLVVQVVYNNGKTFKKEVYESRN